MLEAKSIKAYLHEDGRVELLSKPWIAVVSEMTWRQRQDDTAWQTALSGYVRAWPHWQATGYTYSFIYWRKPLGYLVPFVRWTRESYWKFKINLAWAGFIDADLDGGEVRWRDFTLNIVAVQKKRTAALFAKLRR